MKISSEEHTKFLLGLTDVFSPVLPNYKSKSFNTEIVTLGDNEFIEIKYKILPEHSDWVTITRMADPEIIPINYESGCKIGEDMKLTVETL
jgi:hypothetical protein